MKKILTKLTVLMTVLSAMTMMQACSSNDEPEEVSRADDKVSYRDYYDNLLKSEFWFTCQSAAEREKACQLPEETLPGYTTDELIDICLYYPFSLNYAAYNDFLQGFIWTYHKFNAYNELLKRTDAADAILKFYDQVKLAEETARPNRAVYPTELNSLDSLLIELMILSGDFPEMYTEPRVQTLERIAREKLDYKERNTEIFSPISCGALIEIIKKIEASRQYW